MEGTLEIIINQLSQVDLGEKEFQARVSEVKKLPAEVLEEIQTSCSSSNVHFKDLDSRSLEAISELPSKDALLVLKELAASNLEHVSNKSAFLCGLIKSQRQKGKKSSSKGPVSLMKRAGPDEALIKELLDRTGYSLDVSMGQRKYGGPPPESTDSHPPVGHEVYCGKIPSDLFEDTLVPMFEKYGKIWDLRLMIDPISGKNRGFCFITYVESKSAHECINALNNYEIIPGKLLKVNISIPNVRLFLGNIPRTKSREEILEKFKEITEGLVDVIVYASPDDPKRKNRGFAFLDYDSHKNASGARRHLLATHPSVWGQVVIADWAFPLDDPNEEIMQKVKTLYVQNIKSDVTEEEIKEKFEPFGKVERIKRVKYYGFVHFADRESAEKALQSLQGLKLSDVEVNISFAKPLSKNKVNKNKGRFNQFYKDPYFSGYYPYFKQYEPMNMRNKSRNNKYIGYDYYYGPGYSNGYFPSQTNFYGQDPYNNQQQYYNNRNFGKVDAYNRKNYYNMYYDFEDFNNWYPDTNLQWAANKYGKKNKRKSLSKV